MQYKRFFIYGVPGSGKTTFATALANKLGWRHVELDVVRAKAQVGKIKEHDPFVSAGTTDAWRYFGDLTAENAAKGLQAVRDALQPYVLEAIRDQSIVAEAAFIDPQAVKNLGRCRLLTVPDEAQHRAQFFANRRPTPETEQSFRATRYNHAFLVREANKLGIEILENTGSTQNMVAQALTYS